MKRAAPLSLLLSLACESEPPAVPQAPPPSVTTVDGAPGAPNLLVFSRTTAFRHDSIDAAVAALLELARQRSFSLTATDDPSYFRDEQLAAHGAVVFLLTTGDVLDSQGEAA